MEEYPGFPRKTLRERLKEIDNALASVKSSLSTMSILVWIIFLVTCTSTTTGSLSSKDLEKIRTQRTEDNKQLIDRLEKIESSIEFLSRQKQSSGDIGAK